MGLEQACYVQILGGWKDGKRGRRGQVTLEPQAAVLPADEFNRVIIPVKRGEENTDYVNASFIDVSSSYVPRVQTLH